MDANAVQSFGLSSSRLEDISKVNKSKTWQ